MWEKGKEIGKKVMPLLAMAVILPCVTAETNQTTGYSQEEGTILGMAVFAFLALTAIIFWILPQKEEKKISAYIIGIGIAIAITAVIFYFINFATGWDILFWTKWIDYAGHKTAVLTAVAGAFLILLFTAYQVYNEKNPRKERNIVLLGFLAMLVYSLIILLPALLI